MRKYQFFGFAAATFAAVVTLKFWRTTDSLRNINPSYRVNSVQRTTATIYNSKQKTDTDQTSNPNRNKVAAQVQNINKDSELLDQKQRIEKLRQLNEIVKRGDYNTEHLGAALFSDERMWLKAANIQSALNLRWTGPEAEKAFLQVMNFLENLDPKTNPDSMATRAYHTSIQLLADLNLRSHGKYDESLKDRYEKNQNSDFLKTIFDSAYKLKKIAIIPSNQAVAILRESTTNEYVDYARRLLRDLDMSSEDRGDLNKYLAKHGNESDWTLAPSDDRNTKLMKLNGIAISNNSGKAEYIFRIWHQLFFSQIKDDMSFLDWRALTNPSYELAQALWTENDKLSQKKIEKEILKIFKKYSVGDTKVQSDNKQNALVNLAVAYLDLCLSNLTQTICREELAKQKSFGYVVARNYLSRYLERPDAAITLGTAKAYVEEIARDSTAN